MDVEEIMANLKRKQDVYYGTELREKQTRLAAKMMREAIEWAEQNDSSNIEHLKEIASDEDLLLQWAYGDLMA